MVTAELAVGLPTVVVVTLLALSAVSVVMAQLRCVDAAAVAARLAGRGEPGAAVNAAATAAGPTGLALHVTRGGGLVTADVVAAVRVPGVGRLLPAFVVHERVVAPDEPGTDDSRPAAGNPDPSGTAPP